MTGPDKCDTEPASNEEDDPNHGLAVGFEVKGARTLAAKPARHTSVWHARAVLDGPATRPSSTRGKYTVFVLVY